MSRNDYPTMPNQALRQSAAAPQRVPHPARPPQPAGQPMPRHNAAGRALPPANHRRKKPSLLRRFWWVIPVTLFGLMFVLFTSAALGFTMLYANRIFPGVSVAGIDLGGMTEREAAQELAQEWQAVILRDGERTWRTDAVELGVQLDAAASAQRAFAQGHGEGGLAAIFGAVEVAPVVNINADTLTQQLILLSANFEITPVNAGVELVDGQVRATPPQNGRMLDVAATLGAIQANPVAALANGELDLVMKTVTPTVADSSPLVAQAQALLSNPLDIQVYDPVTGDSIYWSSPPAEWGNWLTAIPDASSPIGLALDADAAQVRNYLEQQAARSFDASRSLDMTAAVQTVRDALQAGRPQSAYVIVDHTERRHTVRSGETITSIGWDYGVPYLYIVQANGGLESPAVGQEIIIPAADEFLLYDVVPNKRIVVDLSEQRTRVYENGALKWDWVSSTGINSSPTWTGIYQVISHEPNAYAGNWNLYMPNFIGVYQPVPGSEFTNGFHGFPTRGGGQLLWENSLGTRVTYGCILLSDQHVQLLYDWAEEGVVVEIRA